jgi:hypothetical protein
VVNARWIATREAALEKRKLALLNELKRANSNVRRARSAAAKKRAATAAVNRKINDAIGMHLANLTKQGYKVKGIQMGTPMRRR